MTHVLSIVLASCTMSTPGMIPYCYCMLLYVVDRVRYSVGVYNTIFHICATMWVHTLRVGSVNNDLL